MPPCTPATIDIGVNLLTFLLALVAALGSALAAYRAQQTMKALAQMVK